MADKPIKKLMIEPGCITCGACEYIAPEAFEVTDRSRIRENVDLEKHDAAIEKAVRACPVNVIKYTVEK
jgi:ferredoxin